MRDDEQYTLHFEIGVTNSNGNPTLWGHKGCFDYLSQSTAETALDEIEKVLEATAEARFHDLGLG